ncbi:FadR/GntR family transcriptional regulator [Hyphococcus sp. DH-69]|uniref:FadR/GntR family transcriptional regulator n=1 Tax=Hyphococcus formosus TaxID=3143534 RepID=UPI00398B1E49
MQPANPERPAQIKQPRIAEIIADALRQKILSGELEDGGMLPKQDELENEYAVSPPSIREALRILETEGLLTVQRGKIGGAVVHRPRPKKAAYMLALVMQSRSIDLQDLVDAMRQLEPACAAACADRKDRHQTVLPKLRAVLDLANEFIEDAHTFIGLARQFHIEIVAHCGNETMSIVVGALEQIWSAQVDLLGRSQSQHGSFANLATRKALAREHEEIYNLISDGDSRGVEEALRKHYSSTAETGERRHEFSLDSIVNASTISK